MSLTAAPRIAMILTSHDTVAGTPSGYWFEELAAPYYAFKTAGWDVTIASVKGGHAPRDPMSLGDAWMTDATRRFQQDAEAEAAVAATPTVADIAGQDFDAVFLVGGVPVMWDFANDPAIRRIVEAVDRGGGIVSAICHGAAGLIGPAKPSGTPLVAGRVICSWTDSEERALGIDAVVPFLLETRLRELGADFQGGENFSNHVRVDGRLITGQNPMSSLATAHAVIGARGFARKAA
jgi:putative intracellular protease/amidase